MTITTLDDASAFVADFLSDLPAHMREDAARGALAAAAAVLESEAGYVSAQTYLVMLADNMGADRDPSVNL